MVQKLGEVTLKVARYYKANDPQKAAELLAVLQPNAAPSV
jgi:hypothetical protein